MPGRVEGVSDATVAHTPGNPDIDPANQHAQEAVLVDDRHDTAVILASREREADLNVEMVHDTHAHVEVRALDSPHEAPVIHEGLHGRDHVILHVDPTVEVT